MGFLQCVWLTFHPSLNLTITSTTPSGRFPDVGPLSLSQRLHTQVLIRLHSGRLGFLRYASALVSPLVTLSSSNTYWAMYFQSSAWPPPSAPSNPPFRPTHPLPQTTPGPIWPSGSRPQNLNVRSSLDVLPQALRPVQTHRSRRRLAGLACVYRPNTFLIARSIPSTALVMSASLWARERKQRMGCSPADREDAVQRQGYLHLLDDLGFYFQQVLARADYGPVGEGDLQHRPDAEGRHGYLVLVITSWISERMRSPI